MRLILIALMMVAATLHAEDAARKPVLFIVGDSTVNSGSKGSTGLKVGWGHPLAHYFDLAKIDVQNLARSGRSSRTFQTEGHWDKILEVAKPGDFLIVQMGHNDAGPLNDTARARGTIRGVGEESTSIDNPITKKMELVHTYGWYMRKYCSDAKAKGMTTIICSPVPRVPTSKVAPDAADLTPYIEWARQVAQSENVFFIDLNHNIMQRFTGMTPEEIQAKYFAEGDHTHTNPAGADLNAQAVVEGIRALKDCELAKYLLEKPAAKPQ